MAEPIVQLIPKDEGFYIELRLSEPSFGKGELTKREFTITYEYDEEILERLTVDSRKQADRTLKELIENFELIVAVKARDYAHDLFFNNGFVTHERNKHEQS